MKAFPIFPFATLVLLSLQCKKENDSLKTVDFACNDQPAVCDLSAANGNFAIEVFKQINHEEPADKNIFISPFSISTALTMTANGAAAQTFDGMWNALKISGLEQIAVNESYKKLLETLPHLDSGAKLKLANSIWPQVNYPVLENFLTTNATYFGSEVKPVDFENWEAVIEEVNGWVEDNTEGLIKETLKELPNGVVMLLINAIYFKGEWRNPFDPDNTHEADFYTESGIVKAEMMNIQRGNFLYFENDQFQAIDLPYGDSVFSMSVFLPKEGHDVKELIGEMNAGSWNEWLASFQNRELWLSFPKFKLEYDIKLKKVLSNMGMDLAFSDAADFSNMITGGGVKIDDVIHKTFVEVNEKGTEAAGVTVVEIIETSFGTVFNANHPFLFAIRDNKTNSILFMGKVVNPKG
jgi:serpin B